MHIARKIWGTREEGVMGKEIRPLKWLGLGAEISVGRRVG
jgi:hypothetical protein